jgi:hypothetical protein
VEWKAVEYERAGSWGAEWVSGLSGASSKACLVCIIKTGYHTPSFQLACTWLAMVAPTRMNHQQSSSPYHATCIYDQTVCWLGRHRWERAVRVSVNA